MRRPAHSTIFPAAVVARDRHPALYIAAHTARPPSFHKTISRLFLLLLLLRLLLLSTNYYYCYGYFRFIRRGFLFDLLCRLAVSFGHACGDPGSYVAQLVEMLGGGYESYSSLFAGVAGVEIVSRCGDSLPSVLRGALLDVAVTSVEGEFVGERVVSCACQLLGLLGDRAHEALLRDGRLLGEPAVAALQLIRNRHMKQEDQAVPVAKTDTDLEAVVQQGIVDDVGVDTESPLAEAETDTDLDVVLSESLREALLLEQQELQEAILRSKVDCPNLVAAVDSSAPTLVDDRLLLLCFNRCPRMLFEVLLESPLPRRLLKPPSGQFNARPRKRSDHRRLVLPLNTPQGIFISKRDPRSRLKTWHLLRRNLAEDRTFQSRSLKRHHNEPATAFRRATPLIVHVFEKLPLQNLVHRPSLHRD